MLKNPVNKNVNDTSISVFLFNLSVIFVCKTNSNSRLTKLSKIYHTFNLFGKRIFLFFLLLVGVNNFSFSQSAENQIRTIVIDAGHGGKDPGAIGKYGTMEKDVVLDITKRVGRMLEKKTGIKVVYTRTEDIFIPLWKRTQIANESGGKLFMSIHVNASTNRKIKGFETFLHSWDKTGTAIDVAARENAVIKFEEKKVNYEKLSMERKITATMASSMFLKESEVLAAGIQEELDKLLTVPNRGVKQAGFYVLSGASMPCVLFEGGFISNPSEEKNLKSPSYRKKIAQGVYKAIIKFKSSREKVLAQE